MLQSIDYVFGLKAEERAFRTLNRLASVSGFVRYRLKIEFCHLERDL